MTLTSAYYIDSSPELLASHSSDRGSAPLLTIGIPAYNHEQYVRETLSELQQYSGDDIEVIIIDDYSKDATARVVLEALDGSVSYQVFKNEKNQGLTYGLGFLLSHAKGRYFLACASDDIILARGIKEVLGLIKGGMDAPFIVCGAENMGATSGPVYNAEYLDPLFSDVGLLYTVLSTNFPRPLLLQSTIFNTEDLRRVNPWSDRLILDDWPTFVRASRAAIAAGTRPMLRLDITLTKYRSHAGGIHNNLEHQLKACLEVADKAIESRFKKTAKANVYSDIGAIYLFERRYSKALKCYFGALRVDPSVSVALRLPSRVWRYVLRKVLR